VTGNHYIMDAVVGAIMMLVTYVIYETVFRRRLFPKLRHTKFIL